MEVVGTQSIVFQLPEHVFCAEYFPLPPLCTNLQTTPYFKLIHLQILLKNTARNLRSIKVLVQSYLYTNLCPSKEAIHWLDPAPFSKAGCQSREPRKKKREAADGTESKQIRRCHVWPRPSISIHGGNGTSPSPKMAASSLSSCLSLTLESRAEAAL
jgi:hypothetical protein